MFNFLKKFSSAQYNTAPQEKETIDALWRLEKIILDTLEYQQVIQTIVDSLFSELGYLQLGYAIVVLALIDHEKQELQRASISQTEEARKALLFTKVPFLDIKIPMSDPNNLSIKAIKDNTPQSTHTWIDILTPLYSEGDAEVLQKAVGIKSTMIYPVAYHGQPEGVLIFSMVKDLSAVSENEKNLIRSFTDIVGLAVQNAKLYTSLQITTDQLKTANFKLQELDKLKDEFVSLASHELRTPLTSIKGSISAILEGYAGEISDETKKYLTAAFNENDRLIRLVNNLLNSSRIEAGRFTFTVTDVDLHQVIKEVVSNMQMAADEKYIYLKYEAPDTPLMVKADSDKIREVVINLIGNSLKFTVTGGITVSTQQKDGVITTSVKDTGPGMKPEDLQLLFKKFSQVKDATSARPVGGTGLGLYISKQIVEGLQGKIGVESTVGEGSTFYFSLPATSSSTT